MPPEVWHRLGVEDVFPVLGLSLPCGWETELHIGADVTSVSRGELVSGRRLCESTNLYCKFREETDMYIL